MNGYRKSLIGHCEARAARGYVTTSSHRVFRRHHQRTFDQR